jgi:hypothetical protein
MKLEYGAISWTLHHVISWEGLFLLFPLTFVIAIPIRVETDAHCTELERVKSKYEKPI